MSEEEEKWLPGLLPPPPPITNVSTNMLGPTLHLVLASICQVSIATIALCTLHKNGSIELVRMKVNAVHTASASSGFMLLEVNMLRGKLEYKVTRKAIVILVLPYSFKMYICHYRTVREKDLVICTRGFH